MHYFEIKLLKMLNFKCWMCYVDDTFILIENPFDINHVLKVANSVDSHIQFTFELEDSNTLPFLDVLVIKCDSSFKTCVYRKPFSVSCPPHALSNHPANQKISAFYTYVYRALNICSDSSLLKKELNYLKFVAIKRGFNPSVINQAVKKFTKPPYNCTLSNDVKIKPDNSVVLPFYLPFLPSPHPQEEGFKARSQESRRELGREERTVVGRLTRQLDDVSEGTENVTIFLWTLILNLSGHLETLKFCYLQLSILEHLN